MRYYISDLHFFHKTMIETADKRNFADVAEMNSYMIQQWNNRVKRNDEVVVLGDLSFGNGTQTNELLEQLKGRIYLIIGNHDHNFLEDKKFCKERLKAIVPYKEMNDNNRTVVLSHYPTFCYNGQFRRNKDNQPKTYMLYGHVHHTKDFELVERFANITRNTTTVAARQTEPGPIPCQMINCFCMDSDYIPLTLDEWIEVQKKREEKYRAEKREGWA